METASLAGSCTNCNTPLSGTYCHQCGIKHSAKRTGPMDVLNALLGGIFSIERSLPGTLKNLSVNPGKVVRDYWKGSRGYHLSPGQMIFYSIFILGLHIAFIDEKLLGFNVKVSGVDGGTSIVLTPQLLFLVLMLPLTAIMIALTFRKRNKSISEHVIAAVYIFTFSAISATVLMDILGGFTDFMKGYTTPIFLLALFFTGTRIYSGSHKWYLVIRDFFLQILVFFLLVALIILTIYIFYPDYVKLN